VVLGRERKGKKRLVLRQVLQQFFLGQRNAIDKSLLGRFAEAVLAGMSALLIIVLQPLIQILLQLGNATINLFAESYCIKFILYGTMETLTDTISLGGLGFGLTMVDILDG
jgi:hypothetical protein